MTQSTTALRFSAFWQRPSNWYCPPALLAVGVTSLLVYAGLHILWHDVGGQAEALTAILGLAVILIYGRGIRNSAPLWLLLAALVVQALSWWLGYQHHPQWVADYPELRHLARLFIFVAVAWWLGGSTRNTLWLWGLAALGYLVVTLLPGSALQDWSHGLNGQRVDFGIRNAQHSAMLFGTLLLGLLTLAPRLLRPGRWRALRGGAWMVATVLASIAVLICQTRAVWLGLVLALPVALGLYGIYQWFRGSGLKLRQFCLAVLGVVLLAGIAAATLHGTVSKRLMDESSVIERVASGHWDDIPYTSVGIRINTWRAASEWIAERPWVGWGGEGRSLAIDHTDWLPDSVRDRFGHLHNFFIEVWVAYGLLGVAVIATLVAWIGHGCWHAWRAGVLPGDIALFGAAFFVYWLVVNQFESYESFWTGMYVHNIIVGGLVTHIWQWQRQQQQAVS